MARLTPTIPEVVRLASTTGPDLLRDLAKKAGLVPLKVIVSAGTPSGGACTFTLRVCNLNNQPCRGLYKLEVFVSETVGSGPGGDQTISVSTGTTLETLSPGLRWHILTNSEGTVVLTLTYTGSRAVNAAVVVAFESSEAVSA